MGDGFLLPVPGGRPSLSRHKTTSFPGPQGAAASLMSPGQRGKAPNIFFLSFVYKNICSLLTEYHGFVPK